MNKINYRFFWLVIFIFFFRYGYSQIPRMVIAGGQQIFVIEPDKSVSWVFGGYDGVYDVWPLSNGNFLFSHKYGVCEVNPGKKIVWEYSLEHNALNEINSCQPLDNGNILILDSGNNRLIEVNRKKDIMVEIKLPSTAKSPHDRYRIGRKIKKSYYVSMLPDKVLKFDRNGKQTCEINMNVFGKQNEPFYAFETLPLKGGNLLFSTGYDGRFLEVTPDSKVVWEVSEKTMPWLKIQFSGGAVRLSNGNTILCNADWHIKDHEAQEYQLLEITKDYKLGWAIKYSDLSGLVEPYLEKKTGMNEFRVTQVKIIDN